MQTQSIVNHFPMRYLKNSVTVNPGHENLCHRYTLERAPRNSYMLKKFAFTMKLKSFSRHSLCLLKSSPIRNEPGGRGTCYGKARVGIIRFKNTKKLPEFYWNNYFYIFTSFDSHMSTAYQKSRKVVKRLSAAAKRRRACASSRFTWG